MYFIGDNSSPGTYYFYSPQANAWIVADIGTGKAAACKKLALLRVKHEYADVLDVLEKRGTALGQDDDRWLMDGEEVIPLLRDYSDDVEILMMYYSDGSTKPYGKVERDIARSLRGLKDKAEWMLGDD